MKKLLTRMLAGILTIAVLCSVLSIGVIAAGSKTFYFNPGVGKTERSSVCSFTRNKLLAGVYIEAIAGPATIWLETKDGKQSNKVEIDTSQFGETIILGNPGWFGGNKNFRVVVKNRYSHNNPISVRVKLD